MLSAEDFVRESDEQADPWPPIAEDGALIDHRSHLGASDAEQPLHLFRARFPSGSRRPLRIVAQGRGARGELQDHAVSPADRAVVPRHVSADGQVQAACDTAKRATARLVGVEPPRFENNETTFEELYARIQRTSEFVEKFQAEAFRDDELRKIELNMSAGVVSLTPEKYLTRFALPNFYFHVTTAYDILRHNGVTLGKRDYLGELSLG